MFTGDRPRLSAQCDPSDSSPNWAIEVLTTAAFVVMGWLIDRAMGAVLGYVMRLCWRELSQLMYSRGILNPNTRSHAWKDIVHAWSLLARAVRRLVKAADAADAILTQTPEEIETELTRAVGRPPSGSDVLAALIAKLGKNDRVRAEVAFPGIEDGMLRVRNGWHCGHYSDVYEREYGFRNSINGLAFWTDKQLYVPYARDNALVHHFRSGADALCGDSASIVGQPIHHSVWSISALGVLGVESTQPADFTAQDLTLIELYSSVLARVIERDL